MKIFCDTNVLIAAFRSSHPHHNAARPVLEKIIQGKDEGYVAAHTLAEVYAVLTRMPSPLTPSVAWQLIEENVMSHFQITTLTANEYADVLEAASKSGIEGGKTYDALLLKAAEKSGATRILTFNVAHFQSIAPAHLTSKITAP
jgi:predicted nucleic acid-binding protein